MGQTIEFMVVRDGQTQQPFQVGAHHYDRGDEVSVFLPLVAVLACCEEKVHLRNTKLQDKVG
jgi:hypothetical protein